MPLGGGSVKVPGPTAQEKQLLDLQIKALTDALGQSGLGASNIQALQPILFEQLGLKPTFEMRDVFSPERQTTLDKIEELKKIPEFITQPKVKVGGSRNDRVADNGGTQQVANPAFATAQAQLKALNTKLAGFKPIGQESTGKITSFDKIVDPNQQLVDQNTKLMNQRLKLALQGKLPVGAALQDDFRQGKEDLMSSLQKQLGTGFASSTPGIEALGDFAKNKNIAFDAARRGDITALSGITQGQSGINDGLLGNSLARSSGVAGAPFQTAQSLASLGGNPLAFLQNQRSQQFQADQANAANSASALGGIGSLIGTVAPFFL